MVVTPGATRPDAARQNAISDHCGKTDARRESLYLAFGVATLSTKRTLAFGEPHTCQRATDSELTVIQSVIVMLIDVLPHLVLM